MVSPKIIECPRDAMQVIKPFIPTTEKVNYLQFLLQVGFHSLDFGSFVSARAVPQMQDTSEVLDQLDLSKTKPNYWQLLPILEVRKQHLILNKFNI